MAYIFKIKIDGTSKPPHWRKVKVNETICFDDLHMIIQVLFGWGNSHMYQFSPKGYGSCPNIRYNFKDDMDDFSEVDSFPYGKNYDAELIQLQDYFHSVKEKMVYIYDFGDDWKHIIELVEITNDKVMYPVCIQGKGCDMIDDCGGVWGFYDMVEAVNNNKHPEHKAFMEWLGLEKGDTWNLLDFDLEGTNSLLREVWGEYLNHKSK